MVMSELNSKEPSRTQYGIRKQDQNIPELAGSHPVYLKTQRNSWKQDTSRDKKKKIN